jgi:hypothetical protein
MRTGNERHRVNWRGRLVLQVQIRHSITNGLHWRDAVQSDFPKSICDHCKQPAPSVVVVGDGSGDPPDLPTHFGKRMGELLDEDTTEEPSR